MTKPRSGTRAQEFVSLDGQACYQHVSRKWNAPRQGSSDRWLPSVGDNINTPLAPSTLIRQTGSGKITGLAMAMLWATRRLRWTEASKPLSGFGPINHLVAHRLLYRPGPPSSTLTILTSCNIFQLKISSCCFIPNLKPVPNTCSAATPVYIC